MSGPPDKYLGLQSKDFPDVQGLAQALSNAHLQGFNVLFATCPDPRDAANTWFVLGGYPEK
jgi:hypothetical protein